MIIEDCYLIFTILRSRMIEILNVISSQYPIEERIKHAMDGSMKLADCFVVQRLLAQKQPKRCLEIGSFLGFSTGWLLACGREWNMHVTALDPNMRHRIFDNPRWMVEGLNAEHYPDRLNIISGFFGKHNTWSSDYENYIPKRSQEWVENFLENRKKLNKMWEQRFDCIYIDADHSYSAVLDGFENALPLLNPGGMMIFHDALTWPGVNQALNEIKSKYINRAKIEIIDGSDIFKHPMLKNEPSKVADGIGYFQLLK